jgi:hypothetical protein
MLGDHPNEFFHHLRTLLLAELMLFRQFIGQVPRGNRCGRRFGSRCHVKRSVCLCSVKLIMSRYKGCISPKGIEPA